MKFDLKICVLCLSLTCLAVTERFQFNELFSAALADGERTALTPDIILSAAVPSVINAGEPLNFNSEMILITDNTADTLTDDTLNETDSADVSSTPDNSSGQVSEDDYLIPKTVYIGVDSIAAPEELPETAALPEPTDSEGVAVDDLSAVPVEVTQPVVNTEISASAVEMSNSEETFAPVDDPEPAVNSDVSVNTKTAVISQNTESLPPAEPEESSKSTQEKTATESKKQKAVAKQESKNKAPEIKQVKTRSINSVSKRIKLFESIDLSSELDVPSGLPEDLDKEQDNREILSSDRSADSVIQSDEIAAPINTDEQADDTKKPAVVVNIDDNLQIDSQNEWGWTKLMAASIEGDLIKVNDLLDKGANPNIAGDDGRSPLMAASWNKHYDVVEALINARADVNLSNRDGWTALSFASWNGDVVIVNSLLRVSANKFIKTADGFTPLQLAQQKGHREIVELLK